MIPRQSSSHKNSVIPAYHLAFVFTVVCVLRAQKLANIIDIFLKMRLLVFLAFFVGLATASHVNEIQIAGKLISSEVDEIISHDM